MEKLTEGMQKMSLYVEPARGGPRRPPKPWWMAGLGLAALAVILALPFRAQAGSLVLPKTGQTLCYDQAGSVIACAGTGQDGETQVGAAWPTPRFTDNRNGTVTDNLSGLSWLKNASCSDLQPASGKDWFGATATVQTLHNGLCQLSDASLPGDWRLPNVNELESLVDLSRNYPPLPDGHPFINVADTWYWSSTVQAVYPNNADGVDMGIGNVRGDVRDQLKMVWPVKGVAVNIARSGQSSCWDMNGLTISCAGTGADGEHQAGVEWPSPRFLDNGNGTVTDRLTGLVWLKQTDCYAVTSTQGVALTLAGTLAGGTCKLNDGSLPGNWRLPNRKEMRSLVSYQQPDGASWLDAQGFANVRDGWYWTSDSSVISSDKWQVKLEGGAILSGEVVKLGQPQYLLPVRGPLGAAFTLQYIAGAGGTISGTTPQTVTPGGGGSTVTASASSGYRFVSWSDGLTSAARTDTNVQANLSVTANFAVNTNSYALQYSAGANGSLSGSATQIVSSGGSGSTVTAIANTGYHFVSWSDGVTSASRTDTGVTANITVSASFAITTFTLKYSANANGSITGTATQVVNWGASGTAVTAVANTGYHFVSWSDGVTSASRTDTGVTSNITVSASFAANLASYTLQYSAGANGTISGKATQVVTAGGSGTTVTAFANTGYRFVSWSDGVTSAARTDTGVRANITVSASFASNTFTPKYSANANGTISGTATQIVNAGASGTTVTAVANTGYHFVSWSDGVTSAARTELKVSANITVSASFAANIITYTLKYSAAANGTISGNTSQTVNSGASGTTVTAVAKTGYHFVSWSDGVASAARTDTAVKANLSVSASFAINQYTITFVAGLHGSISGTLIQKANYGGGATTVTATANKGYHFVNWTDANNTIVSSSAGLKLTAVTANRTITANFR